LAAKIPQILHPTPNGGYEKFSPKNNIIDPYVKKKKLKSEEKY